MRLKIIFGLMSLFFAFGCATHRHELAIDETYHEESYEDSDSQGSPVLRVVGQILKGMGDGIAEANKRRKTYHCNPDLVGGYNCYEN